ncbi:hypothetical protein [Hoeflea prorocentri]|uniref:HprK-related kinase A n=1 Tax=Hoeflea prorocentri TaxID=1922333 RepID=A0A9X3UMP2_9HYPH|nr:hypothetical protein [Hoeflea prorocentri]MCY6383439.1 hypothetical protein [Hoeflea prorocentri]MDA5401239.1 hypothetical protein [Hoeflea prorocentri]
MPTEKTVGLAGATVCISARSAAAQELLHFLFSEFRQVDTANGNLSLELDGDDQSGFILFRDGSEVYRDKQPADAAVLLLAEVIHSLASRGRGELIMHAAAISANGRCALLPGVSGAGKSTLSAWLDFRGYHCLSDELACIALDRAMSTFPRPICLETDVQSALAQEIGAARHEHRLIASEEAILLKSKSGVPAEMPRFDAVFFVTYKEGSRTVINAVPRSKASVRLLGSLANADNFDDRGFAELSEVVQGVDAYEITYGDLAYCGPDILHFLDDLGFTTDH